MTITKIHTFFVIISSFSFFCIACNLQKSNKLLIRTEINKILDELKLNAYVEIKNISIVKENSERCRIEIEFKKQKVVHPEQQEVLISFILNESEAISDLNDLEFVYYVEGESTTNTKIITYDNAKIAKVKQAYKNPILLKIIRYCLENFEITDSYVLNKSINYVSQQLPENTLNKSFFELVTIFSSECSSDNLSSLASDTFILVYSTEKEFAKSKEYKRTLTILSDIWNLCCSEGIENASEKFFKANLSIKSCN